MKRIYIAVGVLAILSVVAGVYVAYLESPSVDEPITADSGPVTVSVTPLSAEVSLGSVLRPEAWSMIASTSNAVDGTKVKTSAAGRAIVAREADIISSLDNNTEITINLSPDKKQSQFAIVTGKIWSKVARALEQDEVFDVYTPTMVAAVRGTSFGVSLDPKRSLLVTEGIVWVTRRNPQTGERIASSTIAVEAGNTVEDNGVDFLVRKTTAEDKDDWYRQNNPEPGTPPPQNSIEYFIENNPQAIPPAPTPTSSPTPIPNTPTEAAVKIPSISSVSPRRFDPEQVDTVRISGESLKLVTQVLLNKKPVEFNVTSVGVLVINTDEFRDGDDTYDLAVTAPSGTATLNNAFVVETETAALEITRTSFSYDQTQASYIYVSGPGMGSVDSVLIANEPVQFQIVSATELRVAYPYLETTVSVEVRAEGQSASGTVGP